MDPIASILDGIIHIETGSIRGIGEGVPSLQPPIELCLTKR